MIKWVDSWLIMNPGGAPTPDKPTITLVNHDPGPTVSSLMNLRVADIQACQACYQQWSALGAHFLTPPIDRGPELRCYMRARVKPDTRTTQKASQEWLVHERASPERRGR